MKDNFQEQLAEIIVRCDVSNNGTVNPLGVEEAQQALTQLFKDYIEAQRPEWATESYWAKIPPEWKPVHPEGNQQHHDTGYNQALQQYKSNLLEGLSDE